MKQLLKNIFLFYMKMFLFLSSLFISFYFLLRVDIYYENFKVAWMLRDTFSYQSLQSITSYIQIYKATLKDKNYLSKNLNNVSIQDFRGSYYGLNGIMRSNGYNFENEFSQSLMECDGLNSQQCMKFLLNDNYVYILYNQRTKHLFILNGRNYGND